jgi:hypothetical protein
MLTIAGGVILGFVGIVILLAIVSSEEGCACLLGIIGLAAVGIALLFAVGIWGDKVWTVLGTLILASIGASAFYGVYDAVSAWIRKRGKE